MIAQTNIKALLESYIRQALESILEIESLPSELSIHSSVKRGENKAHGQYSSNIGFILTQFYGLSASIWVEKLRAYIPKNEIIEKIELGGLGFINFFLKPSFNVFIIKEVLEKGALFGCNTPYIIHSHEHSINFDLDRIQYAHARICIVLRQLKEQRVFRDKNIGLKSLDLLQESHEISLISLIRTFPEVIKAAASTHEPHQIAYFLRELANELHNYYNILQLVSEEKSLNAARWCLLEAVRQVLSNGLRILGVSAPESM